MRTAVLVVVLAVLGSSATAAPRPRNEHGVTVASASDASPGVLDAHARRRHGEIMRQALLDVLRRSGADVRHAGIGPRQIDASIIGWRVTPRATGSDVTAQVRVVVCDSHGKMLSIVTGRATVSGRTSELTALREQALAEAVGSMMRSLPSQLERANS